MKNRSSITSTLAFLILVQLSVGSFSYGGEFSMFRKNTEAPHMMLRGDEPSVTMLTLYAGVAFGGKVNTAYYLKAKSILFDKVHLDGSLFYRGDTNILYNANISFGKMVGLTAGIEWGSRFYYPGKDSALVDIKFRNVKTGEYANFDLVKGLVIPQQVTTYALGFAFSGKKAAVNFWRDKGRCWQWFDFKFEALYAPEIVYSNIIGIPIDGSNTSVKDDYEMENVKVSHWGVRMVLDIRHSSKIHFTQEFGLRPGIQTKINEEGTFKNGYLRIGIGIGLGVGGRRALDEADLDD
jgi:hypothetical protein